MSTGIYKHRKGWKHTKKTKDKMSLKKFERKERLGYINSPKTRKKISKALKGRTYEEIHGMEKAEQLKKEASIRFSGKNHPMYGKHFSKKDVKKRNASRRKNGWFRDIEKTKEKLRKNNPKYWLGKYLPETTIKKMSESHKGIKWSEEHKRIMRKMKKEWHKENRHTEKYKKMCKKVGLANKENAKNNPNYGMRNKHRKKESIEKYKIWRKNQVLPKKDTSIELKIQDFLKQLKIEFFTHQYMRIEHGYQCDILIPSMNMVIECDGDYWHKYPVGKEVDHIRTSELLDNGFKVLRLWECEIRKLDINGFKQKIMELK